MKIQCLGSSSSGNCYILSNNDEVIVLEAGVKFSAVKEALSFDLSKVKGVVCSHLHGDHSKYLKDFVLSGIPCLADESVFNHYGLTHSNCIVAKHQHEYKLGGFSIKPFSVEHDVPTFGFLLNHHEMGKTIFITDTGEVTYTFKNLNNIIIEANFSNEIIERNVMNGIIHPVHEKRVKMSHLSLEKCVEWLKCIDLSNVNNIVLVHLSSQNSDSELFKQTIINKFSKNVYVAGKRLNAPFNKLPF